jgi:hypothetical protein
MVGKKVACTWSAIVRTHSALDNTADERRAAASRAAFQRDDIAANST